MRRHMSRVCWAHTRNLNFMMSTSWREGADKATCNSNRALKITYAPRLSWYKHQHLLDAKISS